MTDWEKCVAFHGHQCGGLAIGYKAALYAARLLGLAFSQDEEVVCISENDACGVDAIQALLGCSVGKGNLFFHPTGKQAFSFYSRGSGRSVRLVLKRRPEGISRGQSLEYYRSRRPEELFEVKRPTLPLPEPARLSLSRPCDGCGEETGERWLNVRAGKSLCPDCLGSAAVSPLPREI